ncbi:MAG: IPTL-CTERM sorting domain-containing protein, partial [Thermodesulfobacteriota bacterium]
TIQGLGADVLTISGGGATRIFLILSPASLVNISDLTLIRGNGVGLAPNLGGAILVSGNVAVEINRCVFDSNGVTGDSAQGGALLISGNVSDIIINDTTFSNNSVSSNSSPLSGAIEYSGDNGNLVINRCTFNNNSVTGSIGSTLAGAIGIFGEDNSLTVTNSTFSENSTHCTDDNCVSGGGALFLQGSGSSFILNNSTFSNNSVSCSGPNCIVGGDTIASDDAPLITLYSSIITTDSNIGNCGEFSGSVNINSLGYNITDDDTCINGSEPGDRPNTDPGLSPAGLRDNGGFTETIAISEVSAAFDTGDPACPPPSTDQRGIERPQAAVCDVGAYQLIVRDIPTMNEWGMIAAAAGLGLIGVWFAARRRKAADS